MERFIRHRRAGGRIPAEAVGESTTRLQDPRGAGQRSAVRRILASPAARLPLAAALALTAGGVLKLTYEPWADPLWFGALVITGAPVTWKTLRGMFAGHFASDVVAMLAIVTAVVLHQPVSGLVIVLMQTGGELLERYAEGRASRAVRDLEDAAPRIGHRVGPDGLTDIAADEIAVGDVLLVRPGEMLPADGIVTEGDAHIDTARITGEPIPLHVTVGVAVQSGAVNLDRAFTYRATAAAKESLYARVVEMVRTAQAEKSPIQRLADKYAVWFTPVTILACVAVWFGSHDPLRVLAVLVVATPCPLILATPVAVIGGINAAARRQVIVRTGAALELIGSVDVAVFDKTGTLTIGHPEVAEVVTGTAYSSDQLLAFAASIEANSSHVLARPTVGAAKARGLAIPLARDVVETPGRGVRGIADGHDVAIGAHRYIAEQYPSATVAVTALRDAGDGLRAFIAVDGVAEGTIIYADVTRPGLEAFFARLASLGVKRTLLLSGDHQRNVSALAASFGITEAYGDLLPDDKVRRVNDLRRAGHRVLMTGDGTNDAPALAAATVGIALVANGGGVTAEAADIVVLTDDLSRVADVIEIGARATSIAKQSIGWGLGLSGAAMLVAAAGFIPPTIGALLQEVIDVAVILNALRAGRPARAQV
jgi:heavy metal translocating P-type ATPase